jgi:hypothetical protein
MSVRAANILRTPEANLLRFLMPNGRFRMEIAPFANGTAFAIQGDDIQWS